MTNELIVLLGGREIGRVEYSARGRVTFAYDQAWRSSEDAYPLSLSMPLAATEHGSGVTEAFLWGLLPDNEQILDRWAQKYQVSPRNVFALISKVGEDCAGAVQFVSPERLEAVLSGETDNTEWLDESDIAKRLRILREDHAAWRLPRDTGQFSLAGAQPKTALLFENGRWGVPSGRTPTTHILKPPAGQFDGHAENEHLCLAIARAFGLPTASSYVRRFGEEIAIVVERYDRVLLGNEITRVHQEDVCQALGIMPTRKYQNEGGPGVADIVELLRTHSSERDEDVRTFISAVAFNWLIAGADAHAKNYSLLISSGPRVRLAPLYDVASVLPYDEFDIHKLRLAMKIGGEYKINDIGPRQWRRLAQETRLDADDVIAELRTLAQRIPDEVHRACAHARMNGLDAPIMERLATELARRAEQCQRVLGYA